jgi:CHAD domain-containing protein
MPDICKMKIYLYKYFKKKIHSILEILKKPESAHKKEEIHKLRVNIKKVRAIFHLLKVLSPKDFEVHSNDVFTDIYNKAGKIRELQMNRNLFNQYNLIPSNTLPYLQYIKQKERKVIKVLKKNVVGFDHKELNKTSKKLNQLCTEASQKKVTKKFKEFINGEVQKITKLKANIDNPYKTHKLRKHLKSLDAIVTLLFHMEPNGSYKKILASVKQSGIVLGDWHDKEVLIDSLKNFIKKNKNGNKNKFLPIKKLIIQIKIENKKLLKTSIPKINSVVQNL